MTKSATSVLCLGALLFSAQVYATRPHLPPSVTNPQLAAERVPVFRTARVDHEALRREDEQSSADRRHPGPVRFAAGLPAGLSASKDGLWEELGDQYLWRLEISSEGALSLNLRFSHFKLPPSALLWLHDPDGASLQGPFSSGDRDRKGGLSTPVVLGDRMVIELLLDAKDRDLLDLEISGIYHGYRGFGEQKSGAKQGSCNIDVVCPEGDNWRDQIRAVARYSIDNQYLCTGTLLNNTAEDGRPLFLTADHCEVRANNANTMVVYWNYESPSCGMLSGGSLSQVQHGATFLATKDWDTGSDFTLVELDQIPDAAFNVYYAGWDRSGSTPQSAVAIHHPSGDEKAISFENDPLTSLWETHWRVADWDLGTTEQGSSGSCLFNSANGLCVGQESGGYAACGNDQEDWFGKLSVDWNGGGTPDTRVSDYLDPIGSGVMTLQGRDGGGVTPTDFDWLVPAAASASGIGGSVWKSEIGVANPSANEVTARLYFVSSGSQWPGNELGEPLVIPAGGALYLDDPLAAMRPTSGLLVVSLSSEKAIVSTRTYNAAAGVATYGQGIPAIRLAEASASSHLILPLVHSIPGRFHTNVGIVQTSSSSIAVRVRVHTASGQELGSRIYSMTGAWFQANRILDEIHHPGETLEGGWIEAELVAGSPSYWMAYASVVDENSGDPTYVLPVPAK